MLHDLKTLYICRKNTVLQRILVANKLNLNNRFYTTEAMHKMVFDYDKAKMKHGEFYGIYRNEPDFYEYKDGVIQIKDIAFLVNELHVRGNSLVADLDLLETPSGKSLKESMEKDSICFRPVCWGFVQSDGEVQVERLVSINAILRSEDSFRNIII